MEKDILQKEESINKRQQELDALQEKILREEKEHWADYEKKLAEVQAEKENQQEYWENLQREKDTHEQEIKELQEKILREEKEHWADYEKKLAEIQAEKEENEKNLAILQEKILREEKEHWQEYEQKISAFEREKFEHNLNKLTPETKNIVETLVKQYRFFK